MRIADKMAFEQVKTNIAKNRSQMSDLQAQASTQKRVTKPSDDPLAAAKVLANRVDLSGNKQFTKSLGYAKSFLDFTDQSLNELTEVLVRAKELAIQQSSDGASNENSRHAVAMELEQLYDQMVAISNRKLGDRFIFGGFSTRNSPFDPGGNYAGDSGEMMIHVDKDTFVAMNVPGSKIFLGDGINPEGVNLAGPAQAKTIEELENQLHPPPKPLGMPQSTIEEDVNFSPRNSPQVRGPASIMSGLPTDPNDQSNAQQKTAPATATATDTDTTDSSGGVNLFRLINSLRISLNANDKVGVQNTLDNLDDSIQQVVLTRAQVGSRGSVIDNYLQTMEKQKVENKISTSQLEDADMFSTVSDITKAQSTLQATLETSGKLIQPSLLQFLR